MKPVILKEGLDYQDLVGQLKPKITIDEYSAKMGSDSEIVTLTFVVYSKLAANDLVSWLEIGYDFVLDASVSEGEIEPGKYLVFVEMNRRTAVPKRIIEILDDLKTLTDFSLNDWTVEVDQEEYSVDEDILKKVLFLSPHAYREVKEKEKQEELNEFRELAGLSLKRIYETNDNEIKNFVALANIK